MNVTRVWSIVVAVVTMLVVGAASTAQTPPTRLPFERVMREVQARYQYVFGYSYSWPGCCQGTASGPIPAYPPDGFYGDHISVACAVTYTNAIVTALRTTVDDGPFLKELYWNLEGTTLDPTVSAALLTSSDLWLYSWLTVNSHNYTLLFELAHEGVLRLSHTCVLSYLADNLGKGGEGRVTAADGFTTCDAARGEAYLRAKSAWNAASWTTPAAAGIFKYECAGFAVGSPVAGAVMLGNSDGRVGLDLSGEPTALVSGSAELFFMVAPQVNGSSNSPPVVADSKWHSFDVAWIDDNYTTDPLAADMPTLTITCAEATCSGSGDTMDPCACRQKGWTLTSAVGILELEFNTNPDDVEYACVFDPQLPPIVQTTSSETDSKHGDDDRTCGAGGAGAGNKGLGRGSGGGAGRGARTPSKPTSAAPGGQGGSGPSSSGKNPEWFMPVELATGAKVERALDLSVALPGPSFNVYRGYCSDPNLSTGTGLMGARWSLSIFTRLQVGATNIELVGSTLNTNLVLKPSGSDWKADGATTQKLSSTTLTIGSTTHNVYRLEEPGSWNMDFFRDNNELRGLLLQEVDSYGNTQTYSYTIYKDITDPTHKNTPRLTSIYLNGQTADDCVAEIQLAWHLEPATDESSPSAVLGKLQNIRAYRYDSARRRTLINSVTYDYVPNGGASISSDVGTAGDLVQVTTSERVDESPELPFRTRVTQYRYHSGGEAPSTSDERRNITGGAHQLKHIVMPEQIEFLAQQMYAGETNPVPDAAMSAAGAVLTKNDGDSITTATGSIAYINLPAKIVGYTSNRVSVQYLQTACGCSGGSQGTKENFTYYAFSSPTRASATVAEAKWNGTSFVLYRTHYHDMEYRGNVPYLVTYAIEDAAATTNRWVWAYHYNAAGNLDRSRFPSACQAYTPSSGSGAWSYTANTSAGLVFGWAFNSDHRITETRVANGDLSGGVSTFNLLTKITYPTSPGTNERKWLPTQIERFTGTTTSSSVSADEIETTTYEYRFLSGDKVAWVKTSVEAERVAENGPGGDPYDTYEFFDVKGMNVWSRAADKSVTTRVFDTYTGAMTSVTRNDSATALHAAGYSGIPSSGWGRSSEGGSLTTTYTCDALGRVRARTSPGGVVSYTIRALREDTDADRKRIFYYAELSLPHLLTGTATFDGPIAVSWYNAANRSIRSTEYEVSTSAPYNPLSLVYTFGTQLSKSTVQHHLSGLVQSRKDWQDVTETRSDPYYTTAYTYDELGRVATMTSPVGTITRNTYDVLDRVMKVEVGTDTGSSTSNMQTVAEYFYDSGGAAAQGIGDGYVTVVRQHTGESGTGALSSTAYRDTKRTFDFRGRVASVERPAAPHEFTVYDNLDRVTARGLFSSVPTGIGSSSESSRGLYTEYKFSQRGLMYKQRVAIDSTNLTSGFLETNYWFDEEGRTRGEWAPNAPGTKREYDGLGRMVKVYVSDRGSDDAPGSSGNYADVANGNVSELTDDTVLEQTEYTYCSSSQAWPDRLALVKTLRRNHGASTTGALSTSTAVASYVAYFYDAALRRTHTVDFGTASSSGVFENGTAPTWPPSPLNPPSFGDSPIVSEVQYNKRGLVSRSIDPKQHATEYRYDDLSRRTSVIENAQGAAGSLSITWSSGTWAVSGLSTTTPDEDRVTSFIYDGSGNVVQQIAHTSDSTSQVTQYTYNTVPSYGAVSTDTNSLIASKDLLAEVAYPREDTGQPGTTSTHSVVKYSYNRLGELRTVTDQNGTKHTYTRDDLGRVLTDVPNVSASTIDTFIKKIAVTYDSFGRLGAARSFDNLSTSHVANAVEFMYRPLWQVERVFQNVKGDISRSGTTPTGDTVVATYAYTDTASPSSGTGNGNYSRLASLTYPSGNTLAYGYGSGVDDRISRIALLGDGSVSSPFAEYSRVGLDMFAAVDYSMSDVVLDRTFSHDGKRRYSGITSQSSGVYPGWDRHGRVTIQAWVDGDLDAGSGSLPTRPPLVDEAYTYDAASNRLSKDDMRPRGHALNKDQRYSYDDLDRLTEAKRGTRTNSPFTALVGSQKWTLDVLGNWTKVQKELGGSTLYGDSGETEDRSHNEANEITNRYPNGSSGSPTLPFTYDDAGNLRTEKFTSSLTHTFAHDAWNRLVGHQYSGSSIPTQNAEYEYNGLHWRTLKRLPPVSPSSEEEGGTTIAGAKREMYYSAAWQLIEERIIDDYEASGAVDRVAQEFWGIRYIDDPVMRRITAGETQSYYHLTDVQFSTVAIIGTGADMPVLERVQYDAYGKATHRYGNDFNDDGAANLTDGNLLFGVALGSPAMTSSSYDVRMDLNRDGVVDFDDDTVLGDMGYKAALADGDISDHSAIGPDNVFGYDGYVFAPELQRYCVRFRWYDPVTGRWMQRDPAGYVDTMALYAYVAANPQIFFDPLGLDKVCGLLVRLYTGSWCEEQEVYDAATSGAGQWLFCSSPVRGGYAGVGTNKLRKGKGRGIDLYAQASWTMDSGCGFAGQVGYTTRKRLRDPRNGQYISGRGGLGFGVGWSEDSGWSAGGGCIAEGSQNGKNFKGGGTGAIGVDQEGNAGCAIGINYGVLYAGMILDLSKLGNLFGIEELLRDRASAPANCQPTPPKECICKPYNRNIIE